MVAMTTHAAAEPTRPGLTIALRRAAKQATLAPSVHNSQPWRFVLEPERLTLLADRSRRLNALDPSGRQLVVSCGCALLNARVSLAADGITPDVVEFPEGVRSDTLAYLDVRTPRAGAADLAAFAPLIGLRQTNRRQFAEEAVGADIVATLCAAARAEQAGLFEIVRDDHRDVVAALTQQADALQNADPAYRAEIRAWTTDDPQRRDGVPALAVPHVDGTAEDEIPIRDFDTRGSGWLPAATHSTRRQCLLLLTAESDEPRAWLRAGQALERVLLEVTRHGLVTSPLTQVVEQPATRAALRRELGMTGYPMVLLRVGRAAVTPGTLRRELADVLVDRT